MYIDIKSAYHKLPKEYKFYIYRKFIRQDNTVDINMVNKGIRLMEGILNGR